MNEKFEQLAEQAMVHDPNAKGLHTRTFSLERFAELIVKECADLCESFGESGDGFTCKYEILDHFGVEE